MSARICVYYGEELDEHWVALSCRMDNYTQDVFGSIIGRGDSCSFHLTVLSPLTVSCCSKRRLPTVNLYLAHPAAPRFSTLLQPHYKRSTSLDS